MIEAIPKECECAFCSKKIDGTAMTIWEMPAKEYDESARMYIDTRISVSICDSCNRVYEQAFKDNLVDLTKWNDFINAKIKYEVDKHHCRRMHYTEIIKECELKCEEYENNSESTGKTIDDIKDYVLNYSIIESLRELDEYKKIGISPQRILELDKLYLEKCIEVNELTRHYSNKIISHDTEIDCLKVWKLYKDGWSYKEIQEKIGKYDYSIEIIKRAIIRGKIMEEKGKKRVEEIDM